MSWEILGNTILHSWNARKNYIVREKPNQILQVLISQGHFFHCRTSSQAYIYSLTRWIFFLAYIKPDRLPFRQWNDQLEEMILMKKFRTVQSMQQPYRGAPFLKWRCYKCTNRRGPFVSKLRILKIIKCACTYTYAYTYAVLKEKLCAWNLYFSPGRWDGILKYIVSSYNPWLKRRSRLFTISRFRKQIIILLNCRKLLVNRKCYAKSLL